MCFLLIGDNKLCLQINGLHRTRIKNNVKKLKLILLVVLSFSTIWTQAQQTSIGINIGGNYPNVNDSNAELFSPSISGYCDINFNYSLNEKLNFLTKLI